MRTKKHVIPSAPPPPSLLLRATSMQYAERRGCKGNTSFTVLNTAT